MESTFTRCGDVAADLYPWLPVRWIERVRYPSVDRLAAVPAPVLVIHSPDDELIGIHHGRALFEACPGKRQFVEIRHGHSDGYHLSGPLYRDGIDGFVTEHFGPEATTSREPRDRSRQAWPQTRYAPESP